MGKSELSAFQTECQGRVMGLLKDAGPVAPFAQIRAAEDVIYLVARVDTPRHHLQIYIYEDDAGFYLDDTWIHFEHQDFKEPSRLIDEFCAALHDYLA
jgi:hypothetical protein